jgi:hypothetical protein
MDEGEFQGRITELTTEFNELSNQAIQLTATIQNVLGEIVD